MFSYVQLACFLGLSDVYLHLASSQSPETCVRVDQLNVTQLLQHPQLNTVRAELWLIRADAGWLNLLLGI